MSTQPETRAPTRPEPSPDLLQRLFHEPNRLAIMSALCAAHDGLAFNEIKHTCTLTDGNLNRHLKVLEEAGVVRVAKTFVGLKPRTTVSLSREGLRRFSEYLDALAAALEKARKALPEEHRAGAWAGQTVPA
jgi:DNA-binding transcriptional ArsR family regulator